MARKRIEKNLAYDDVKHLYYVYFDYGHDASGRRIRSTGRRTRARRPFAISAG